MMRGHVGNVKRIGKRFRNSVTGGLVFCMAFSGLPAGTFVAEAASQSLVRIEFNGTEAREAARYDMGQRIREVEQGPDGNLWLLEDGSGAKLLKLSPKS